MVFNEVSNECLVLNSVIVTTAPRRVSYLHMAGKHFCVQLCLFGIVQCNTPTLIQYICCCWVALLTVQLIVYNFYCKVANVSIGLQIYFVENC